MTKLPRYNGKKIISILKIHSFEQIRVKGSHHFLRSSNGLTTIVPVHGSEIIGPGLLSKILKDCDLTVDDFLST